MAHERLLQWTPRQREVLELIARGRTNAEIAQRLGVSLAGAKWHVSEVLTKLNAESREEAAAYWRERSSVRGKVRRLAAGLAVPIGWKAIAAGGGVAILGAGAIAGGVFAIGGDDDQDTPMLSANVSATPTPAQQVWDMRDFASPFQEEILADEFVTDEEYERAIAATITCLESKGYHVNITPGRDAARAIHWTARLDAHPADPRPTLVAGWGDDPPAGYMPQPVGGHSWCDFQYMFVVSVYWFHQNRPTPEYEAAAEAAFKECLVEKGYGVESEVRAEGVPVGAPPVPDLLRSGAGKRAFDECVARTRRAWGVALFNGTSYGVGGIDDPATPEDERGERLPDVLPTVTGSP